MNINNWMNKDGPAQYTAQASIMIAAVYAIIVVAYWLITKVATSFGESGVLVMIVAAVCYGIVLYNQKDVSNKWFPNAVVALFKTPYL